MLSKMSPILSVARLMAESASSFLPTISLRVWYLPTPSNPLFFQIVEIIKDTAVVLNGYIGNVFKCYLPRCERVCMSIVSNMINYKFFNQVVMDFFYSTVGLETDKQQKVDINSYNISLFKYFNCIPYLSFVIFIIIVVHFLSSLDKCLICYSLMACFSYA